MELVHSEKTDFWGLRIRKVQFADAGVYECQVNTDPKMNFAMKLTVTGKELVIVYYILKVVRSVLP